MTSLWSLLLAKSADIWYDSIDIEDTDFRKGVMIDRPRPPGVVSQCLFTEGKFFPPKESWWGLEYHNTITVV